VQGIPDHVNKRLRLMARKVFFHRKLGEQRFVIHEAVPLSGVYR
jgi:hypothetical protein